MRYVAIKDVDIPEHPERCPFINFGLCEIPGDGPFDCRNDRSQFDNFPAWCPLLVVEGEEVEDLRPAGKPGTPWILSLL